MSVAGAGLIRAVVHIERAERFERKTTFRLIAWVGDAAMAVLPADQAGGWSYPQPGDLVTQPRRRIARIVGAVQISGAGARAIILPLTERMRP